MVIDKVVQRALQRRISLRKYVKQVREGTMCFPLGRASLTEKEHR